MVVPRTINSLSKYDWHTSQDHKWWIWSMNMYM